MKRGVAYAPDRDGPTGRMKLGTESNGPFRNITISNVVFDRSRGLALETVDGSTLEDISVSNVTMRDVSNAPIFIRLGSRMRAPEGTPIGTARRINIDNVVVYDADPRYASIISGIPGHEVEGVKISNVRILYRGGLMPDHVARQPADLVNPFFFRSSGGVPPREPYDTPEREKEYPEPSMLQEDRRPAFVLEDVNGAWFGHVTAQKSECAPGLCSAMCATFACTGAPVWPIPTSSGRTGSNSEDFRTMGRAACTGKCVRALWSRWCFTGGASQTPTQR